MRVREIIKAQGYPVYGEVPKATFGAPAGKLVAGSGKRRAKSRINWAAYDRRIKAIQSRITKADLTIMR